MPDRRITPIPLLAVVGLGACSSSTDIDCTVVDPFPWAILVDAVDDATGQRILDGARGWTVDTHGTSRDMIVLGATNTLAAEIPEGTYDVFVAADGYVDWETRGVETVPGVCGGFNGVELEARLRLSAPGPALGR